MTSKSKHAKKPTESSAMLLTKYKSLLKRTIELSPFEAKMMEAMKQKLISRGINPINGRKIRGL